MSYELPNQAYEKRRDENGGRLLWDPQAVQGLGDKTLRTVERAISRAGFLPPIEKPEALRDEHGAALNHLIQEALDAEAKQKRWPSLIVQHQHSEHGHVLMANDSRGGRKWTWCDSAPDAQELAIFLDDLATTYQKPLLIWPHGSVTDRSPDP